MIDRLITRPTPPTAAVIEGVPVVVFTPKDYENLARNLQDIRQTLEQKGKVIEYYKQCLARGEASKDPAE